MYQLILSSIQVLLSCLLLFRCYFGPAVLFWCFCDVNKFHPVFNWPCSETISLTLASIYSFQISSEKSFVGSNLWVYFIKQKQVVHINYGFFTLAKAVLVFCILLWKEPKYRIWAGPKTKMLNSNKTLKLCTKNVAFGWSVQIRWKADQCKWMEARRNGTETRKHVCLGFDDWHISKHCWKHSHSYIQSVTEVGAVLKPISAVHIQWRVSRKNILV